MTQTSIATLNYIFKPSFFIHMIIPIGVDSVPFGYAQGSNVIVPMRNFNLLTFNIQLFLNNLNSPIL